MEANGQKLEDRILVRLSRTKDAALTQAVLEGAGIACDCCGSTQELCEQLNLGASAVLLPEETVAQDGEDAFERWLHSQPAWSDLPILVLARPGADSAAVAQAMDLLGNVTVLERPMRISALVSAVRTAMRARQRQYQIREHLTALERAEAELRADDRRKDEFLAILAHELRNPLAPIKHSLDILKVSGGFDSESNQIRETIERQVNHMVRLVDDLLEVSRITRGKIELRKETVQIAAMLNSAIETSRPLIEAQQHRLQISLPDEPLYVEGDPVRLAQVFSNLLNNAAKYTEPCGDIWLTVSRTDGEVEVSVRDSGTGISEEMLPRVFEMFAQIDRNMGRAQGGLGIGLTLVKTLVEMHEGGVEAHSEGVGRGCRFVVRLPLSQNGAAGERAEARRQHVSQQRVLVVDDNRDAATMLGMLLTTLGVQVKVAFNGPEALDAIEGYKPTTILLDIGMPAMSGHEVAKRIRKIPEFANVKLIALTGWGQLEDRRLSKAAGFDHHLVKPVDIDVLESLLAG